MVENLSLVSSIMLRKLSLSQKKNGFPIKNKRVRTKHFFLKKSERCMNKIFAVTTILSSLESLQQHVYNFCFGNLLFAFIKKFMWQSNKIQYSIYANIHTNKRFSFYKNV